MSEHMKQTEEFITERVNYHGANESDEMSEAYLDLKAKAEILLATLTKEQKHLFRDMENKYRVSDGETCRYYYKAGFGDAIKFITDWLTQSK